MKVKYDTLFVCVIVCVYFVDSIDLINMFFASTSTLSITKACVYYVRNPFHLTKLCPLEHWDRLPMKLKVSKYTPKSGVQILGKWINYLGVFKSTPAYRSFKEM